MTHPAFDPRRFSQRHRFGRRGFAHRGLGGLGATALGFLLANEAQPVDLPPPPVARVKRAIWLFMGGGPSQLELFDYKPGLAARFNEDLPPSIRGDQRVTGMTAGQARFPVAPSPFGFVQSGQVGTWVSELLPFTAQVIDEIALIKTVSTESINHEPAILNISTGSQFPGKPSVGAWLSYGLGRLSDDLPSYVVMTSRFSTTDFVQAVPVRTSRERHP